jgi:hypothetical protein
VPVAAMEPAGPSRRAFYARCALMATIATAVVVGSVLVMADKHEAAPAGHELAGAYYAVTKPPAFNFNSELPCSPAGSEPILQSQRRQQQQRHSSVCCAATRHAGSLCLPAVCGGAAALREHPSGVWTRAQQRSGV